MIDANLDTGIMGLRDASVSMMCVEILTLCWLVL